MIRKQLKDRQNFQNNNLPGYWQKKREINTTDFNWLKKSVEVRFGEYLFGRKTCFAGKPTGHPVSFNTRQKTGLLADKLCVNQ